MRINLTVKAGPHEGEVFEFSERANFIVGRSERAHFRLPVKDNSISRIHFMIEMNPPQCRLTDMESTNGTLVNGRKVATADLKDGDLITAGKTILLVSVTTTDEPLATPTETIPTPGADGVRRPPPPRSSRRADRRPFRRIAVHGRLSVAASSRPSKPREVAASVGPSWPTASSRRLVQGPGNTTHEAPTISLCPACRGRIGSQSPAHPGLPGRPRAGPGRHGGRLPGPPHGRRRARGLKTIQPAVDPSSGGDRPLPPRGEDPQRAGSPEHRVVPRAGRVQRNPLFRDGLRGGNRRRAFAEAASVAPCRSPARWTWSASCSGRSITPTPGVSSTSTSSHPTCW